MNTPALEARVSGSPARAETGAEAPAETGAD